MINPKPTPQFLSNVQAASYLNLSPRTLEKKASGSGRRAVVSKARPTGNICHFRSQ